MGRQERRCGTDCHPPSGKHPGWHQVQSPRGWRWVPSGWQWWRWGITSDIHIDTVMSSASTAHTGIEPAFSIMEAGNQVSPPGCIQRLPDRDHCAEQNQYRPLDPVIDLVDGNATSTGSSPRRRSQRPPAPTPPRLMRPQWRPRKLLPAARPWYQPRKGCRPRFSSTMQPSDCSATSICSPSPWQQQDITGPELDVFQSRNRTSPGA